MRYIAVLKKQNIRNIEWTDKDFFCWKNKFHLFEWKNGKNPNEKSEKDIKDKSKMYIKIFLMFRLGYILQWVQRWKKNQSVQMVK